MPLIATVESSAKVTVKPFVASYAVDLTSFSKLNLSFAPKSSTVNAAMPS